MENRIEDILQKERLEKPDLIALLSAEGEARKQLFRRAEQVKQEHVGNKVFFRGLIEFSNICSKDCYYCGIRKGNRKVSRYNLTDEEILEAARFAYENIHGAD